MKEQNAGRIKARVERNNFFTPRMVSVSVKNIAYKPTKLSKMGRTRLRELVLQLNQIRIEYPRIDAIDDREAALLRELVALSVSPAPDFSLSISCAMNERMTTAAARSRP